MIFHWIAAIALKLRRESLLPVAPHLIAPLVREINMENEGDSGSLLKRIAKEASMYVKKKIGSEEYDRLIANCTSRLDIRRTQRKKERAQQVISPIVLINMYCIVLCYTVYLALYNLFDLID